MNIINIIDAKYYSKFDLLKFCTGIKKPEKGKIIPSVNNTVFVLNYVPVYKNKKRQNRYMQKTKSEDEYIVTHNFIKNVGVNTVYNFNNNSISILLQLSGKIAVRAMRANGLSEFKDTLYIYSKKTDEITFNVIKKLSGYIKYICLVTEDTSKADSFAHSLFSDMGISVYITSNETVLFKSKTVLILNGAERIKKLDLKNSYIINFDSLCSDFGNINSKNIRLYSSSFSEVLKSGVPSLMLFEFMYEKGALKNELNNIGIKAIKS